VDRENTYVFAVSPSAARESVGRTLSYWSTGDGDDTMITLWNAADEPQDLAFTLFFSRAGQYRLAVHLEPRATRMFNISEIIRNQIPDADGNTIPLAIHEGRAAISGSRGRNEHILVVVDAGTYNVRKATCGPYCVTCDGVTSSWVTDDPFAVALGNTHQLSYTVHYDTGDEYDATSYSSWSSTNNGVGTVSGGLVTSHAVGSMQANVRDVYDLDYYHSCFFYPPSDCPGQASATGGSPGNVVPTVTFDSFSPNPIPQNGSASVDVTVTGAATVTLTITSSDTGRATFSANNSTTLQTSGGSIGILAGAVTQSSGPDLSLVASYQGTTLATAGFSVSTGACSASYAGHSGDGYKPCPSSVTVTDTFNLSQYCPLCGFTCVPLSYDSSFLPGGCVVGTSGIVGGTTRTVASQETGTFNAVDCSYHNIQLQTRVTNVQGVQTNYNGGTIGLKCSTCP